MWNQLRTDDYEGMIAETISIPGYQGDMVHAYLARPLGKGPFPGVVLIPHAPGWDEFYREASRRFTQHGYITLCPDIYCRFGHGTPEEVVTKARSAGGVHDASVMGDCAGSARFIRGLPNSNNKIGVIGTCSGGRHAFMAACEVDGIDAAVDCWGGRVVMDKKDLTPAQPVAAIDLTEKLKCPLLGLFGNDDQFPTPAQVDQHEAELKKYGKNYKFYRYDGAGHGFWYYHTESYRPKAAMDSWNKVFAFFGEYLR
jgi:carboxymethylenebutenolidase